MLTGKQRAALRSMANRIEPIFQIGKSGVNDTLVAQLDDALEARELIKVTILRTAGLDTRQTCDMLARRLGAEPVQSIGNRFTLYRPSRENPVIHLD